MKNYDLVILGGGPGGYVSAIHAAILAKKNNRPFTIAIVEEENVGGTCLNWGCIPTKRLLAGAELLHKIASANSFGITVAGVSIDYKAMIQGKDQTVETIRNNLKGLILSHGIEILSGRGSFASKKEILITTPEGLLGKVGFTHAIIATGSQPREISSFPFDYEHIHSSSSLLSLQKQPKSLIIIGGGVIGCEFAYFFNQVGTKVTVLEALPRILPMEGSDLSSVLEESFKKQGIQLQTGVQVEGIDRTAQGIKIKLKGAESVEAEHVLVAIGRKYNSQGIGLDILALTTTPQGAIPVDDYMKTACPNIYAIGDVTGKVLLAHAASHQGVVAVENIFGKQRQMHYDAIPAVVFTHPEIGTVGRSLEKALNDGFNAKSARFPFIALGKAQVIEEKEGFAQLVVEEGTGRILGAQVVGAHASSLISEIAIAIAQELTVESIQETIHPHPTLSEAWHEAALLATGQALHLPPAKKR